MDSSINLEKKIEFLEIRIAALEDKVVKLESALQIYKRDYARD